MNENLINNKHVRIATLAVLGTLSLFLLTKFIETAQNLGTSEFPIQRSITVDGTGKVTAIPDIAYISFAVTESAATIAKAQTAATAKMNDALAYLKGAGIEDKDVKTTSYNVYPKYDSTVCYQGTCPTPKITGYEVSQSVEVKVRDTDKAGDVLQGLGTRNVQNISGPNFAIDDVDALTAGARAKAVADAHAKAETLAKELGVRLGKVTAFYENGGPIMYEKSPEIRTMSAGAVAAPAPQLPTGENDYSVNVSVTYEIR